MIVEEYIQKANSESHQGNFESGLRHGIELMGEFVKWKDKNEYANYMDSKNPSWGNSLIGKRYTTTQLIELFLTDKIKSK